MALSRRADNRIGPAQPPQRLGRVVLVEIRRYNGAAHNPASRRSRHPSDSIVVLNQGRVVATGTAEELKGRIGFSCCTVSPADPADLPKILAAVADLQGAHADENANTVSVLAPNGVATLSEVFRRVEQLDIELADISLRKSS